jgi:hypothetical protein
MPSDWKRENLEDPKAPKTVRKFTEKALVSASYIWGCHGFLGERGRLMAILRYFKNIGNINGQHNQWIWGCDIFTMSWIQQRQAGAKGFTREQ